ncbi:multidrug effflux MFS transporter [Pseudoalteromonas fenneropenaei]|uniref:Bcr/CflA family efflux transporter n=1 Tax=Pseudoalteromonas fenneropenaei TaxID=1737459 RepID=A0ABV7CL52_9GAMM
MTTRPTSPFKTWLILIFLVIFCPLAIDLYLPAFMVMAQSLNVTEAHIQQTVAVFMLSVGLGQLLAGPLADRFGRKPVALSGIILYGIGGVLAAIAEQWSVLMLARVLQGLGACATFVSCFAIVRDSFDSKRSGAMITYLNGIVCFIPALAPIFGAWLTQAFGWRANFLFLTLFAVLGLLVILAFYRETRPADTHYSGHLLDLRRFTPMLGHPQFMFNAAITMLGMSGILVFVTTAPGWIMSHLERDMSEFTAWFTANAVVSIVASFIAPRFIKRNSQQALRCGLALFVLAAVLLMLTRSVTAPVALMLPMFIASLGFALSLGSAAGKALAPFAKQAGTASALIGVMQMSGAGVLALASQTLALSAPVQIAVHFFALAPFSLALLSRKSQQLHPHCSG